jgi:hypothetical protein
MNSQEIDEILQHLENAKYIGASKAVQIIHQLNKERSRLSQRVLDLEPQIDKLTSVVALREMEIKDLKIKLQMEFEYAERLLKEKKWEPLQ